jgi:endonuclease III
MTRAEKARRIQDVLDRLHPDPEIPLGHDDAFTLLVSVVLSAQCTDERVNRVTPALFARARTPAAMARLAESAILRLIRSCGLAPAKARAIKRLSRILVEQHGGRVPDDFAALEALPGVGHKTASVVMTQAFGQPAFPVDTHIHRLAARWRLSSGRNVVETERDLKRIFPERDWGRLHLQLIYFGRQHCPARGHDPGSCPICSFAMPFAERRALAGRTPSQRPKRQAGGAPAVVASHRAARNRGIGLTTASSSRE